MHTRSRLLACIIGMCCLTGPVCAEEDLVATATVRLAGQTTRDWLADGVTSSLGASQDCKGGDVYHFSRDYTLRIETCVDGRRAETKTSWSLAQDGPLDMNLTAGERTYRLLFRTEKQREHMILREASASRIQPTRDHDFVLSED